MSVAMIGSTVYDTLAEAITAANTMDDAVTIILTADTTFGSAFTISNDITLEGSYTITRDVSYTGKFITVNAGVIFTLKDVTIDGNNYWTFDRASYDEALYSVTRVTDVAAFTTLEEGAPVAAADIFIVNGSMIMNGATIRDNAGKSGSGVFTISAGASLTTVDSTITHIYSPSDNVVASVASGATWTINEGTVISNCHAGSNGGISRSDSGAIIMNGGVIEDNTAINANGTVFMFYGANSYFEMNGGIIRNNSGLYGANNGRNAAVYMHSKSTMVMNDGLIEINVGNRCGGIDAPYTTDSNGSTVTIYGGSVINNVSASGYDTADIRGETAIEIYGGTFTQDVNQWAADGFSVQLQGDGTYSCVSHEYMSYACADGVMRSSEILVCVDGVIKSIDNICQCIDGVIKQS